MPLIEWPTRHIRAETLAKVTNSPYFSVKPDDRPALDLGAEVSVGGAKRYIRLGRLPDEYRLSTDEAGAHIVDPVPADFMITKEAGIAVNYPRRPMLRDPGAVALTSVTNPRRISAWSISAPRFEGSVEIDCWDHTDVPIIEAFIDALSDPAAFFEVPLPGKFLGDSDILSFDSSTGDIRLSALLSSSNLVGYFGRVGRRTCRVTKDTEATENIEGADRDVHTIRIAPAGLITGSTADYAGNVFASSSTCRARAVGISATGDPDYGARWLIDWEETRGEEIVP